MMVQMSFCQLDPATLRYDRCMCPDHPMQQHTTPWVFEKKNGVKRPHWHPKKSVTTSDTRGAKNWLKLNGFPVPAAG